MEAALARERGVSTHAARVLEAHAKGPGAAAPSQRVGDREGTGLRLRGHFLAGLAANAAVAKLLSSSPRVRALAYASCALWMSLMLFGGLDDIEAKLRGPRD